MTNRLTTLPKRIANLLALELFWIGQQAVALLPDGGILARLRVLFYRPFLKSAGRFSALSGLKIYAPRQVSIGNGVSLNTGVILDADGGGEIRVHDNVLIGPYCVLRAADHGFSDTSKPIRAQGHQGGLIVIEEDCWLGSHVVVRRGVRIGRGSVIGAHSMVTRDIPPNSIAYGVPARVQRSR